jgi:hypothetical protein
VITGIFFYVGFASWRLLGSTRPQEALWYFGAVVLFEFLVAMFFLRRPGFHTYGAGRLLVGALAATGTLNAELMPLATATSVQIAWPAVVFVTLLSSVWAYTVMVYPNLATALGGAAPQPVRLALSDEFAHMFAPGSRVYELAYTDNALFLEVALPPGANPHVRWDMFWFRRFHPPAIYVQIPRSAVRYIEYTDTFDLAPPVLGASVSGTLPAAEGGSGKPQRELGLRGVGLLAAAAGIGASTPFAWPWRVAWCAACALGIGSIYLRSRKAKKQSEAQVFPTKSVQHNCRRKI